MTHIHIYVYAGLIFILLQFFTAVTPAEAATIGRPMNNNGLVGYWSFDVNTDGITVYDRSGQDHTGSLSGADGDEWTTGKIGGALDFDGINEVAIIPENNSSLDLTSVVTVSLWMNPQTASIADQWQGIFMKRSASTNCNYCISMRGGGTNVFQWQFHNGSFKNVDIPVNSINTSEWFHVAGTFEDTGSDVLGRLYIDGELVKEETFTNTSLLANNGNVRLGESLNSNEWYNGLLDEVRIYNRVLSANEIKRLYDLSSPKIAQTPTVIGEGLVGHWTFDGNDLNTATATDMKGDNDGTLTGSPFPAVGRIGQGLQFNGTSNYIEIPADSALNMSGDTTISLWFKTSAAFTSASTDTQILMEKYLSDNDNFTIALVGTDYGNAAVTDGSLVVKLEEDGAGSRYKWTGQTTWTANTWYHLVYVLDSSDNTQNRIYINAVDDTPGDGDSATIDALAFDARWRIGGTNTDTGQLAGLNYFGGVIDDVRIYNRELSDDEVRRLYNGTRPSETSRAQFNDGLVGYWDFGFKTDGTTIYDRSGNKRNGTLTSADGNTNWISGKIGGGIDLDGSNDYIDLPDIDFGTNSITIAAWISPDVIDDDFDVIFASGNTGDNAIVTMYLDSSQTSKLGLSIEGSTSGQVDNTDNGTAVVTGQWQHVVGVFDRVSGEMKRYVNGTQSGTTDNISGITGTINANNHTAIAAFNNQLSDQHLDGKIDEVRVYNRALSADEVKRLYNLGI